MVSRTTSRKFKCWYSISYANIKSLRPIQNKGVILICTQPRCKNLKALIYMTGYISS